MSNFTDQLAADAAQVFANPDEFGESITYTKPSGATRTINAIVERQPPARMLPSGEIYTPKCTVRVANSSTTGISSAELNAGGNDRITVAVRIGETAQSLGCYVPPGIEWHDAGLLTLDLR